MPARKVSAKSGQLPKVWVFAATLMVSNRKRSVEWYTRSLGLEIVQDLGHWVTVGRKGSGGLLHLCDGSEIGEDLDPGNAGITIHVPGNFARACRALEANGVKFVVPVTKRPWGQFARISDPDGNELTLNPED